METETVRVQVTTKMSKLPSTLGFKSAVSINLHEVIEEFIEDQSGTTRVGSYTAPSPSISRILLKPRSFTTPHLSRLLRQQLNRETPICQYVAEEIALCRFSRGNCTLYQRPFLMTVNVKVIKEERFILPSVSVPFDQGASGDVFQRLLEEQTIDSMDLNETCSICIEELSENHDENVIQIPNCLHLFHQRCIFEWLARHNSCPLCRRVPYEEDQETESSLS